jgi:hypothetical protein
VLTKVYKDYTPPLPGDYVWFIQHFGLLGSDGVIPAAKKAIPRQYWFINKKYYDSKFGFAPTGISNQFSLNQIPDLDREMTDPYVIARIERLSSKTKAVINFKVDVEYQSVF